jgi:hypothetical protein
LVYSISVQNNSAYALNGAQIRLTLPASLSYPTIAPATTLQGSDVVYTLGRLAPGVQQIIQIKTRVSATATPGTVLTTGASITSGTALPVSTNIVNTKVVKVPGLPIL